MKLLQVKPVTEQELLCVLTSPEFTELLRQGADWVISTGYDTCFAVLRDLRGMHYFTPLDCDTTRHVLFSSILGQPSEICLYTPKRDRLVLLNVHFHTSPTENLVPYLGDLLCLDQPPIPDCEIHDARPIFGIANMPCNGTLKLLLYQKSVPTVPSFGEWRRIVTGVLEAISVEPSRVQALLEETGYLKTLVITFELNDERWHLQHPRPDLERFEYVPVVYGTLTTSCHP